MPQCRPDSESALIHYPFPWLVSRPRRPLIMGIINVTPDSFSADGCLRGKKDLAAAHQKAVRRALRMAREGADILDIGGESSRPGARPIVVEEEIARVVPVVAQLRRRGIRALSVDTTKPEVALQALAAGASIVNTIQGVRPPIRLLKAVARSQAALVLMHMRGTPMTMQKNCRYQDPLGEILSALKRSRQKCLAYGVESDKIIVDPGIGFGKSVEHNYLIIKKLRVFKALRCPVLIGPSRKSFLGAVVPEPPEKRVWATAAAVAMAIREGADIVRVHDVKPMRQVADITHTFMMTR